MGGDDFRKRFFLNKAVCGIWLVTKVIFRMEGCGDGAGREAS